MPSFAAPSKVVKERLGSVAKQLRSISVKIDSLSPCPGFNLCLAQHMAEGISELKSELVDVTHGVSLLESDDATLSEWGMTIKESLSDLSLRLKRLQFDQASSITSTSILRVKRPKLEVPTFDRNIMNWATFLGLIQCPDPFKQAGR